jgi:hypothetical protein
VLVSLFERVVAEARAPRRKKKKKKTSKPVTPATLKKVEKGHYKTADGVYHLHKRDASHKRTKKALQNIPGNVRGTLRDPSIGGWLIYLGDAESPVSSSPNLKDAAYEIGYWEANKTGPRYRGAS